MSAETPSSQEAPTHLIYNGAIVPPFFDFEWIKSMKEMKLRPDDVWIVTYPKCGTTWTQQIVRLIINRGKDDGLNLEDAVPWVEAFYKGAGGTYHVDLDKMASPRAFKSHFPYEMMPCGLPSTTPGKYINVVRNPKDVAVSYYRFIIKYPPFFHLEWDIFLEMFMDGNVPYCGYFDHVLSWWAHKDDDNVLFLKYEDMKKDLPTAVAQIAKFISQDISKELVDEIAQKTTFAEMKKDLFSDLKETKDQRFTSIKEYYLRKGEVGDWKNYFTPGQAAKLDAVYDKKMKDTGTDLEF